MTEIECILTEEYIELIKLLKYTGICETGGRAKQMVEDEMVYVNGALETRKRKKVRSGDTVECAGLVIRVSGDKR